MSRYCPLMRGVGGRANCPAWLRTGLAREVKLVGCSERLSAPLLTHR